MKSASSVVLYDEYGAFDMQGELMEVASMKSLAEVSGGGIDGACGNNIVCNSQVNAGACVNPICNVNGDIGCVENIGCL